MKVIEYSRKDLRIIAPWWKILEKGLEMTPFQSFAWNKLLVHQYNSQGYRKIYRRLRYVCVCDDQEIKLIAPLRFKNYIRGSKHIREIELLGADSFSDYVNFIYSDFKEEYFTSLMHFLSDKYSSYILHWRDIPANSSIGTQLKKRFGENLNEERFTVTISLNFESFQKYFDHLSKHTRQNYRTAINRIKRDGHQFSWKEFDGISDRTFTKKLMDVNYARTIEKNPDRYKSFGKRVKEVLRKYMNNFICEMIANYEDAWVLVGYIDDDIVGFLAGSKVGNIVYVMMNKVNPKYEFYSPMIVAIVQYIQHCLESKNGIEIMDFGRGTEQYKFKLGGEAQQLYGIEKIGLAKSFLKKEADKV